MSSPATSLPPHIQRQTATSTPAETEERTKKAGTKEPPKKEEEPLKFAYKAGLDPELKVRFNRMVIALEAKRVGFEKTIDDVREIPRAHVLSTAYHIRERGAVQLQDLRALKDGKDLDGNIWYQSEWDKPVSSWVPFSSPSVPTDTEILDKAKDNAFDLAKQPGAKKLNCAYEGYDPGDAHRKPNVDAVPVSTHVSGHAIDLKGIDWTKFGNAWTKEANAFVASFGLTRPYIPGGTTYCIEEPWHFELAPTAGSSKADKASQKEGGKGTK